MDSVCPALFPRDEFSFTFTVIALTFKDVSTSRFSNTFPPQRDNKVNRRTEGCCFSFVYPSQPATKCCCSPREPIKTLPLSQPVNSTLPQLPRLLTHRLPCYLCTFIFLCIPTSNVTFKMLWTTIESIKKRKWAQTVNTKQVWILLG